MHILNTVNHLTSNHFRINRQAIIKFKQCILYMFHAFVTQCASSLNYVNNCTLVNPSYHWLRNNMAPNITFSCWLMMLTAAGPCRIVGAFLFIWTNTYFHLTKTYFSFAPDSPVWDQHWRIHLSEDDRNLDKFAYCINYKFRFAHGKSASTRTCFILKVKHNQVKTGKYNILFIQIAKYWMNCDISYMQDASQLVRVLAYIEIRLSQTVLQNVVCLGMFWI